MKPAFVKAGLAVAAAAAVTATVLIVRSATRDSHPHTERLAMVGTAWAGDFGTRLTNVETRVSATVDAGNRAEQAARLRQALALGCVGQNRSLRAVPMEHAGHAFAFKMRDDLSPADHADRLVKPGRVIVEATWKFGDSPAVTSLAIFTADGELVFDSMLSFPAVPEPLLFPRHF